MMRTIKSMNTADRECVREVHSHGFYPCSECGIDQNTNGDERTLYRYGYWLKRDLGDRSAITWEPGAFCSIACFAEAQRRNR